MRIRRKHEVASGNPTSGDVDDPELDQLIRIAKSSQVPELLGSADATHTVAGLDGPRMRFEGEGTLEGDKILLQCFGRAVAAIDAKRKRESQQTNP